MVNSMVPQDLYDRLMAVNQEGFDARLYDVAYHALASAMHAALFLESDEPLRAVAKRARDQGLWIDLNDPQYEHSTRSAATRNHESIFLMLVHQAETNIEIRQHNRSRK